MQILVSIFVAVFAAVRILATAAPALLVLTALERWGPVYGQRPKLGTQLKGVVFQLVGLSVGVFVSTPLWGMIPNSHPILPALAFLPALVISDFLQYWEHRLEHKWLFWRIHAVHHSSRDLCATLDAHHFLHIPLLTVIYGLPMGLLTHDPMASVGVVTVMHVWGAFGHSPTRAISIGPLRYLLADNRMHRIHHATHPGLHDRNFGSFLTIWDVMFGTMIWPKRDQWPDTGVAEYGEIETVAGFLFKPFMPTKRPAEHSAPQNAPT